jgi:hypothetical protein
MRKGHGGGCLFAVPYQPEAQARAAEQVAPRLRFGLVWRTARTFPQAVDTPGEYVPT